MAVSRYVLSLVVLFLVVGTPAPAQAQAAPGPFVKQAFDLLMDRFVVPPTSSTLLAAGWEGGLAHAKTLSGSEASLPATSFTDDRGADWRAFLAGYPALVGTIGPSADQHALDRAIVAAMAKSLNSSHTFLTTAPQSGQGQTFGGIGISMSAELIVTDVFAGTPAEAAGLRPGDRIIAVDGSSVEGMASADASAGIRGPIGGTVQLTVRRSGQVDPVVISATRAEITVPWVSARVLEGGIGLLKIMSFPPPDAIGLFDQAIAALEGADIKALVIDVRGNSGGAYATAERIMSRFVREGPIAQQITRQGQTSTVNADGSAWGRSVPIAILVNAGAGSAGELLPSALRENGIGYLVGMHTAGRLAGGQRFPLQDGSSLTVAVSAMRSGKGEEIEHVGLEPDLVVDLDPAALAEGRDSQLEAALTYLKGKLGSQ